MSYQEIMEECFKNMFEKHQQTLISQIKFGQWYHKTFKKILAEKREVTPEDMEQAYIHRDI